MYFGNDATCDIAAVVFVAAATSNLYSGLWAHFLIIEFNDLDCNNIIFFR